MVMLMKPDAILISTVDFARLDPLLRDSVADKIVPRDRLCALRAKLQQAQVLPPEEMPHDVITMNSTVSLRDLDTDEVETYSLAYPGFANGFKNRVSVLASLGTAILGYRAGDVITWDTPAGQARVKVEAVAFQPERDGQYDV